MPESKCLHCHCTMVHCDSSRCTSRSMHIHRQKYAAATGYRPHRHTHIKHITNCVCVCDSHCLMRFWPKSLLDIQLALSWQRHECLIAQQEKKKRKLLTHTYEYSTSFMVYVFVYSTIYCICFQQQNVTCNERRHKMKSNKTWQEKHGKVK